MRKHLAIASIAALTCACLAATGAATTLRLEPHTVVRAAAVSPDGRTLAVVADKQVFFRNEKEVSSKQGATEWRWDSSLQVWDIQQQKLKRILLKREDAPQSVAFSPDGRLLACGSQAHGVQIWGTKKNKRVWTLWDVGGPDTPTSVAFSPDGQKLVTGWASETLENWGRIIFWKINTRSPAQMTGTQQIVSGGKCNIQSVAYSPDGQTVVGGSWGYSRRVRNGISEPHLYYGELRFVNAQTGKLLRIIKTRSEGIKTVVFSPNGKLMATTAITRYSNVVVRLRDAKTGELLHTVGFNKPGTAVAAFSPDGSVLAIGRKDGMVTLWDVKQHRMQREFRAHSSQISTVLFVPHSRTFITGSEDGTLKTWKL